MLTLTRRKSPVPAAKMDDYYENNNLECSFAEEYCGPPVNYDIPNIDPVDVNRIPIAYSVSSASPFDELAIPVVQPILKFEKMNKDLYKWSKSSGRFARGGFHSSGRIVPCNTVDGVKNDEEQPVEVSNQASGSSNIDKVNENPGIGMELEPSESVQHLNSEIRKNSLCSPNSSTDIVECEEVSEGRGSSGIDEISDSHESNQASGISGIDNVNENPEIGMEPSESVQHLNSEIKEQSLSSPNSSADIVECEEVSEGTGSSGIEEIPGSHESNQASGISGIDNNVNENPEIGMERCENVPYMNSEITEYRLISPNSSTEIEECEESEDERGKKYSSYRGGKRTSLVTFVELKESVTSSEGGTPDVMEDVKEKPVIRSDVKKALCYRCGKKNWLAEKESCIVCGAKYCRSCLLRAMGSMSEGRKCITCIGYRIDDCNRASLGKPSRMLKRLLTPWEIKCVMRAELSCEANQLAPHLVCVNRKPLSLNELTALQNCKCPPKKLKPGIYWYDKVSGFWGKEGQKPSQIITPLLDVGNTIKQDASNGNTTVLINGREITKTELWMLQMAGVNCEGNTHFWMSADGSFQEEGQKKVVRERLWDKSRVKLVCAALSLPIPPQYFSETTHNGDEVVSEHLSQNFIGKFLLVGCDQSGTSTIYKQAKILYDVPFSEAERQSIKFIIQSNLYRYITIILESRVRFEEDRLQELRTQRIHEPGPSVYPDEVEENTEYSISQSLQAFSDLLIQVQLLGNMEAFFPAASEEYGQLIEELLHSSGFQATYNRINELNSLPKIANYFLDRAIEISRAEYEPSEMDIVYAEGINSSNGVASMDFAFPMSSQNGFMDSIENQNDPSLMRYQLITVQASNLGQNCKWLHMFEDVDLVLFCVSLTDYNEFYVDRNGTCINKMLASKALLETMITRPAFADKNFLLLLNKFDLLEENLECAPLSQFEWFQDFNPVTSNHPLSSSSSKCSNPSQAQRAYHYIAVKFKRLFSSFTGRKLYVSAVKDFEVDSVHEALSYGREILKWEVESATTFARSELYSESIEGSTTC